MKVFTFSYRNLLKFSLIAIFFLSSCKKKNGDEQEDLAVLQKQVIQELSTNVLQATYKDLANSSSTLYDSILSLKQSKSGTTLENCRNLWKETRSIWEQSEAFLFGPVAAENIDPSIDTWPVDYQALETVLKNDSVFTENQIDNFDDALKGFHPIEFLLFGLNGAKQVSEFKTAELNYLEALAFNLKKRTALLFQLWDEQNPTNYRKTVAYPGTSNSEFQTYQMVYLQLANAMVDICDELAAGKLQEPLTAQNPLLEESPFSKNSLADFKHNLKSIENVYMGRYAVDGKGIEEVVKKYNLSLNQSIKNKITNALSALENIPGTFGEAIIDAPIQVQSAIDAINSLKDELETGLLPLITKNIQQ